MPIAALNDPEVRGVFKAWRDGLAATPRKADYAWTTLARVLSVAKDRGRIPINPCERGGRLYEAERSDKIWTETDIGRLLSVAGPLIEAALLLALWTGQRQGDLLRLPWSAYDGKHIRLRQSKGGRRLKIPVGGPLRAQLEALPRVSPTMLTNSCGAPWTSDGFCTSWGKACAKAGITDLTFHDLRGSAVTRLAVAGCYRVDHRPLPQGCRGRPRQALPQSRSSTRGKRDRQARTENENCKLRCKPVPIKWCAMELNA